MNYSKLRIRDPQDPAEAWKSRCIAGVQRLCVALRDHIRGPAEQWRDGGRWVRLATWNIREFPSGKFGARLDESYYYIAEVISHFDIVALQEIREDLRGLQRVMDILGPDWDFIATDVTEGTSGNDERMVFAFNKRKVAFHHISGEVTLHGNDRIAYPYKERLHNGKFGGLTLPSGTALKSPKAVETYSYRGSERLKNELPLKLPADTTLTLPTKAELVIPAKTEVTKNPDGSIVLNAANLPPLLKIKQPWPCPRDRSSATPCNSRVRRF